MSSRATTVRSVPVRAYPSPRRVPHHGGTTNTLTKACILLTLLPTLLPAAEVEFHQRSEPLGLYATTSDRVQSGINVDTVSVQQHVAGQHFTHWTVQGVRTNDLLGRGITPVRFRILQTTTAICHHVSSSLDDDVDGIKDWYEIHLLANTNTPAEADSDGDGFALAEEYRRDYHPVLTNRIEDGGFSLVLASLSPDTETFEERRFTRRSSPEDLWTGSSWLYSLGTLITNADVFGSVGGHSFCFWTLDGDKQVDAMGCALPSFNFVLESNSVATAHYLPSDQDEDTDGVSDWVELFYYGVTNTTADDDTDSDGHDLAEELRRGYHPVTTNEIADGGWSLVLSPSHLVIVDTNLASFATRSDPFYVLGESVQVVETGTVVTVGDAYGTGSGLVFCYWTLNGAVQTDMTGRAQATLSVTVLSNTIAEAAYLPSVEDADGDGVPDWIEHNYTGSTNGEPRSDGDGDGFGMSEEARRDYHPNLVNEITDGGFSLVLSPPEHLEPGPDYALYAERSLPEHITPTRNDVLPRGTDVTTADAPASSGASRFVYWTVNGIQQRDAQGTPLSEVSFTFLSNTVAEALFMNVAGDGDGDGAPDWLEHRYYGSTEIPNDYDLDGDGFSLIEELRRHYEPSLTNQVQDGGFSLVLGQLVGVNLQNHPRVMDALVAGAPVAFFAATPATTGTFRVTANSHPAVGDWDGDGDLDLFVGGRHPSTGSGQVRVFENTGSPQVMNLVERTTNFAAMVSVWAGITNPAPALGDWTGDGCADLAVGGETGVVDLIGSTLRFSPPQVSGFRFQVSGGSGTVVPAFGDIDGDGWQDLLVLGEDGRVRFFPHTRTPTLPYPDAPTTADLLKSAVPNATGLTTTDVNEDGVIDVLISDDNGNVWEFHGSGAGN